MNIQNNHIYIQRCLQEIEEKLSWGTSESWHNDVFQELSETIQKETSILLSATTLKRVWGRITYEGTPSISTLNTLSQFAGYQNWRDFKMNVSLQKKPIEIKKEHPKRKMISLSVMAIAILGASLFWVISLKKPALASKDYSQIHFSSRPITEGLPNSVIFEFDLGQVLANDIKIQQSWDPKRTVKVQREQRQATAQYYYPGHFRSKLLINNDIIKEHNLFIKSDGWLGTIDYHPIPKYLNATDLANNNYLSFPDGIIEEIKSLEKPRRASFHLVNDFGNVSGDNFTLDTGIRNVYRDKWAVCQATSIVILGTKGAITIPFSIPGCVSDLNLMLNDINITGKENDLSAFGIDFTDFRNIGLNIENKTVSVFVNTTKIYEGKYNDSIGNFVGIRYRFLGIAEVSHLTVKDSTGKVILSNDFKAY